MELIAELPPAKSRDVLIKRIEALRDYVEIVDVPDSPLGRPSAHAVAVSYLARELGLETITHIRVRDLNMLAFLSILGAAELFGLERLVLLTGDEPAVGRPVDHITTEEAVKYAKGEGFKVGVMLSLRRDYMKRLALGADFFLALNVGEPRQMEALRGREVYPYLLVRTTKNSELLAGLRQPSVELEAVPDFVQSLSSYGVKAVIISAPGDFKAELLALKALNRR